MKLALPDRFLTATSDDAPETASENRFRQIENARPPKGGVAPSVLESRL
jgi:hypothetical protein